MGGLGDVFDDGERMEEAVPVIVAGTGVTVLGALMTGESAILVGPRETVADHVSASGPRGGVDVAVAAVGAGEAREAKFGGGEGQGATLTELAEGTDVGTD